MATLLKMLTHCLILISVTGHFPMKSLVKVLCFIARNLAADSSGQHSVHSLPSPGCNQRPQPISRLCGGAYKLTTIKEICKVVLSHSACLSRT